MHRRGLRRGRPAGFRTNEAKSSNHLHKPSIWGITPLLRSEAWTPNGSPERFSSSKQERPVVRTTPPLASEESVPAIGIGVNKDVAWIRGTGAVRRSKSLEVVLTSEKNSEDLSLQNSVLQTGGPKHLPSFSTTKWGRRWDLKMAHSEVAGLDSERQMDRN